MRLISLLSWVLLCGLVSVTAGNALAQSTRTPGQIVVAKVRGSVTATSLSAQAAMELTNGTVIGQNTVVTTRADSSVILLLSNGATINLGPESTLSIDEFLQDPFAESVAAADLEEEPSTSVTKLSLSRGELVGNVKKIRADQGSSFTVNTPVGAAGIRGTIFRIIFRPSANGQAFFSLSTAEGRVLFEAPVTQQQVNVPGGQEVVVTFNVEIDPQTAAVTVTEPPSVISTQAIPAVTQAAIATAAQQIIEATRDAIIRASEPPQTESPPQESDGDGSGEGEQPPSQQQQSEPPPAEQETFQQRQLSRDLPPATTPRFNTTPGDGR
jgi:hypothetical protein